MLLGLIGCSIHMEALILSFIILMFFLMLILILTFQIQEILNNRFHNVNN